MPALPRRAFLAASAAALAVRPVLGGSSPNDRLRVAFVGTGNQGMGLLKRLLAADLAEVAAVCDVNRGSHGYKQPEHFYGREPAREMVLASARRRGRTADCLATADPEKVFAREDVDAVWVVVPDHWHRPLVERAAAAGKHVYCEKPLSLTVADGRAMVDAVARHGVLLQTGSHERSNPVSRFVCEKVAAGDLGPVQRVRTVVGFNNKTGPGPGWRPRPVPEGFDYAAWLGPAPQAAYHPDRCLYRFRFNYDYSGGQITNFGAHSNDMAQWGLGRDRGGVSSVRCEAAEFPAEGSLFNTALKTRVRCRYDDGAELLCESGPEQVQTRFECEDGWIQTGYRGTTASRPELLDGLPPKAEGRQDPLTRNMANFLAAVRGEEQLRAPVEVGHSTAALCHVMNAAVRRFPEHRDAELTWDAAAERFAEEDANVWLSRDTRPA